ncbi:hypothetical protein [Pseudomonas sp. GM55]|uniref:hypothetical protein n=1 Tax=Pseudomonas sp. GM55 TaxID=1144333 RepID=UPI0012FA1C3D|nr:hypothetical protein [Pseudomonas sp. GM55]
MGMSSFQIDKSPPKAGMLSAGIQQFSRAPDHQVNQWATALKRFHCKNEACHKPQRAARGLLIIIEDYFLATAATVRNYPALPAATTNA